ncbi:MAG: hypothetical protein ACSHX9_10605 [Luteolibacter sp.]
MKIPAHLLICFFACCPIAYSQVTGDDTDTESVGETEQTDELGQKGFWEANLQGGNYTVALSRISSVSRHKYILSGNLVVDEVTIDTVGVALARFYFIKPVTDEMQGNAVTKVADRTRDLLDKAANRVTGGVEDMVVKTYPDTTHAKTIEYRVLSESQLSGLYASAKKAWVDNRGRVFSAE